MKNIPLWKRIVGGVLLLAGMIVITEYWGYAIGKEPLNLGLSTAPSMIICILLGVAFGMLYYEEGASFQKNMWVRTIAGAISGALAIWLFGAYLWMRGYPETIYKLELALVAIFAVLPAVIIYRVAAKEN